MGSDVIDERNFDPAKSQPLDEAQKEQREPRQRHEDECGSCGTSTKFGMNQVQPLHKGGSGTAFGKRESQVQPGVINVDRLHLLIGAKRRSRQAAEAPLSLGKAPASLTAYNTRSKLRCRVRQSAVP